MATGLDTLLVGGYVGGMNVATAAEAQGHYLARAFQAPNGAINVEYVAAEDAITADGTLSAALAPLLRGVGLTVTSDNKLMTRMRPRLIQLTDPFISGNLVSGSIGALGWNLLGSGTPVFTRADTSLNSSAKCSLTTSGSTNDRSSLTLGETETRDVIVTTSFTILQAVVRLPSLTNVRLFFGLLSSFVPEPSTVADALGIYYDSAVSPNWQIISRSGSSGTPIDSGVAVANDAGQLLTIYQPVAGTFQFYVGDGTETSTLLGTISSGISTTGMNCGFRVETLTAGAKTARVSYFNVEASATGAYASDTFLEV